MHQPLAIADEEGVGFGDGEIVHHLGVTAQPERGAPNAAHYRLLTTVSPHLGDVRAQASFAAWGCPTMIPGK